MTLDQTLNLSQALNVIGMLQCVFILAIILLKATDPRQAAAAIAFFAVLGLGFGLPATVDPSLIGWEATSIWLDQAWVPTLSYLMILQVAMGGTPDPRHLIVLVLPLIGPVAMVAAAVSSPTCGGALLCPESVPLLRMFAVVPGAVILLLFWARRALLSQLARSRDTRDRYWVVLAFIAFNVINLAIDIPRATGTIDVADATVVRIAFGLAFVYLVTTLMFRIDPKPLVLFPGALIRRSGELSADDMALAGRIEDLMKLDKLYQEPLFSRADLARELDVSENVLSRVINSAFSKSFRKLLNDHRVETAKQLLRDSDMQITQIAFDIGFNSLASFNRVFKDTTGVSPTEFRAADHRAAANG